MLLLASCSLRNADLALDVREFHSCRSSDTCDGAAGRGSRLSTRQQHENNLPKKLRSLDNLPTIGIIASSFRLCSIMMPGKCKNK